MLPHQRRIIVITFSALKIKIAGTNFINIEIKLHEFIQATTKLALRYCYEIEELSDVSLLEKCYHGKNQN